MRRFAPFAVRDLVILLVTIVAWTLDAQARGGAPGLWTYFIGLTAGGLAGLCAFLMHEWGHVLGTWLSGGVAHPGKSLRSVLLFSFDVSQSDRRQFLSMFAGGFIASMIYTVGIVWLAPRDALSGQVLLTLLAISIVITVAVEVPEAARVARGGPLPRGGAFTG